MAYNRKQAYYNKEYKRLITQAKKLYNEMNLGSVLKEDTPSFEKLLKYAGTSSGLKKPTKASLKALRKIQGEEGLLWAVSHTVPKVAREKAGELREAYQSQEEAIKKAKRTITKKHKGLQQIPRKEREQLLYDVMSPVQYLLSQLRWYVNHEFDIYRQYVKWNKEKLARGFAECRDMIDKIENYLAGNNEDVIAQLSKNCEDFKNSFPEGLGIQEVYNELREVKPVVFQGIQNIINQLPAHQELEQAEMQIPEQDIPDNTYTGDILSADPDNPFIEGLI